MDTLWGPVGEQKRGEVLTHRYIFLPTFLHIPIVRVKYMLFTQVPPARCPESAVVLVGMGEQVDVW